MPDQPERPDVLTDSFDEDVLAGRVIGSRSPSGTRRLGADREDGLSVDHGALRIRYPRGPGWRRHGIAYGPFPRQDGLAFSAFVLNGHNTSQTREPKERRRKRLPKALLRRLFWWLRGSRLYPEEPHRTWPPYTENLALGWFPRKAPANPVRSGSAFVMHAAGPENGELWARVGTPHGLPAIRGVMNVPVHYVAVLRERGCAYYAASLPGANGMAAYPHMRPVAIDARTRDRKVYAAIYQSVLGEVNFEVDTRVYGVQVERVEALGAWYGTAHAASRLVGAGALSEAQADVGGGWTVHEGGFRLSTTGAAPEAEGSLATLDPGRTSGLVHALLTASAAPAPAGLVFRFEDDANFWCFWATPERCRLYAVEEGVWERVGEDAERHLRSGTEHALQVLDDGATIACFLDGQLAFDERFTDVRGREATAVGFYASAGGPRLRDFEAHPRQVPIPPPLRLGAPWQPGASDVVVGDDFDGDAGPLDGREVPGSVVWRKALGEGAFDLTGGGAVKVRASVEAPNPGRTAYTIPWDQPDFAELEVEITPPGTDRGQEEKGRGGLILMQDEGNYILINNWFRDTFAGAAISCFFYLGGAENAYKAVWSNIGRRVYWGVPHRLRIAFDGIHFLVHVDDEPVLYRALTDVYPDAPRLAIRRVGIAANWEFGDDTGSLFRRFKARGRRSEG